MLAVIFLIFYFIQLLAEMHENKISVFSSLNEAMCRCQASMAFVFVLPLCVQSQSTAGLNAQTN